MTIDEEYIITLDDGFKYFWPENSTTGAFSAANLREIADYLDEQNKEWQQKIEDYFKNNG